MQKGGTTVCARESTRGTRSDKRSKKRAATFAKRQTLPRKQRKKARAAKVHDRSNLSGNSDPCGLWVKTPVRVCTGLRMMFVRKRPRNLRGLFFLPCAGRGGHKTHGIS